MRLLHSQGGGVGHRPLWISRWAHGCQTLILVFKSRHENLLDDTEALLYCDHQFDRQLVISFIINPEKPVVTRID
jgi:hypothetical protein